MKQLQPISQTQLERWITAPRFKAYLNATSGNRKDAMALYDWDVCISAVFFEVLSYTEVLLRNTIDAQFQPVSHEVAASSSWLHDGSILKPRSLDRVDEAEQQLKNEGKTPTRARVVASLSFGFWRALFNKDYKQLWITHLHHAFPNGTGDRSEVAALLSTLNPFRNRLAHHEAIIAAPIRERHDDLLKLVGLIDADAASWIESRSCVLEVLEWRPPLSRRKRVLAQVGLTPRTVCFHQHT